MSNLIKLDTKGLTCPEPVMMLHNAVRDAGLNAQIEVVATDPSTQRDIPKFCNFLGHTLDKAWQEDDLYYFLLIL